MIARYDKVIILENDEKDKDQPREMLGVVIFDEKTHQPVIWGLSKWGMDEIIELVNKGKSNLINTATAGKNDPGYEIDNKE